MINSYNIDSKLSDKIINVAYRDASITERVIVSWIALRNDEVRKVLEAYKATANSVHSIKKAELPEHIIESLNGRIELESKSENLISKIYFALFSKPIFSATVVSFFVLAIISTFIFRQPATTHEYSEAEIELAQQQLGESIAIVNKVFIKAEQKLENEIINDRVSKQLNKGLNLINEYLIGG
ncbi:MAG: hypothetical protein HKM87_00830 [Ignavibacteriaceae bacterium]|nr:hypothetical protein [Ignavibacteriaceae bacterium]